LSLPDLDLQRAGPEADALRRVLLELGDRSETVLGDDLVGLYLVGSFALGGGDVHAARRAGRAGPRLQRLTAASCRIRSSFSGLRTL
jgi:hypothetical protein